MRNLSAAIVAFIAVAWNVPARADETPPPSPPCSMPAAVSLADRPGTGRSTSSGGSPCVAVPGEIVVESGARRQITTQAGGAIVEALKVPLANPDFAPFLQRARDGKHDGMIKRAARRIGINFLRVFRVGADDMMRMMAGF